MTNSFTVGEQAHIVGEKAQAARGKSLLTDEERDSYHNRILLCPTDHTRVDQNEADWPVEKLHFMKSIHELWVRETLADSADSRALAKQIAVTSIIDAAVELCRLGDWKNWTSYVLWSEPRWPSELPDHLFEFRQRVAAAVWPEEFSELRRSTLTLAVLLHDAASKFTEHSILVNGMLLPDKFYKSIGFNHNYNTDLKLYREWLQACFRLIRQATRAANWFADTVRRDVNPMFFAERGKFLIIEGPFFDLSYQASVLEFTEDEKRELPQSLFKNRG